MEVNDDQKTIHPVTSQVISMAWNKPDGCLWFGTQSSGLGRLKNRQVTYYTKENHGVKTETLVPPQTPAAIFYPHLLTTDLRNYLWVTKFSAGSGKSLSVYNGSDWFESEKFPDDFVHCFTVDSKNTIWLGTENGIYQLAQKATRS